MRPRGVDDNPFRFDPAGESPPSRAAGQPDASSEIRRFGAGTGYDALEQLHKQLATTRTSNIKAFGKDISPEVQIPAIQHLLAFWGEASPYSPPARSPATGALQVIHGYAQIWQRLSGARSGKSELTLAEDGEGAPRAPETWVLQDAGGNELGAEIPQSSHWARCGDVVGVSMHGVDECWLGVIRSMQAEWGRSLHAEIAILGRDSQAVPLRGVGAEGEKQRSRAEVPGSGGGKAEHGRKQFPANEPARRADADGGRHAAPFTEFQIRKARPADDSAGQDPDHHVHRGPLRKGKHEHSVSPAQPRLYAGEHCAKDE